MKGFFDGHEVSDSQCVLVWGERGKGLGLLVARYLSLFLSLSLSLDALMWM